MKNEEKRKLLSEVIELMIYCAYDHKDLVGRPLSYFDYEALANYRNQLIIEKKEIDGE
jgi:hypothetical protein